MTIALMNEPLHALMQSYGRTKATNQSEYRKAMGLHTNSSNNTIYADADGTIAYFHANFIPRRDPRFDWAAPVDGSDPATEWQGLHGVEESPLVVNPAAGWLYNVNNWPWSAAGPDSPKAGRFPGLRRSRRRREPTWRARSPACDNQRTSRRTPSSRRPTTATFRRSGSDPRARHGLGTAPGRQPDEAHAGRPDRHG